MFYDHLEKANNFLENMIDLAEDELDSRIINHLISDPVRGVLAPAAFASPGFLAHAGLCTFYRLDGGEWVFGLNILERYGVIPQALCPESFSSGQSEKMNQVVNTKVSPFLRKTLQHLTFTPFTCLVGSRTLLGVAQDISAYKMCMLTNKCHR